MAVSSTSSMDTGTEYNPLEILPMPWGIKSTSKSFSAEEAWDELIAHLSIILSDEFLSSSHPLVGHLRGVLGRVGDLCGVLPIAAVVATDAKINNLCKVINPKSDEEPFLLFSYIQKAAKLSGSTCSCINQGFWIWKSGSYSPNALHKLMHPGLCPKYSCKIEVIVVPVSHEEKSFESSIGVSDKRYYLDEITHKLHARDAGQLLLSRTIGKASSDMKLYFIAPEVLHSSDSLSDILSKAEHWELMLNQRASYLCGQKIYGDAILANIGYSWESSDLLCEDLYLSAYYRLLVSKLPDGAHKRTMERILQDAELTIEFISSLEWERLFSTEEHFDWEFPIIAGPLFEQNNEGSPENYLMNETFKLNFDASRKDALTGIGTVIRIGRIFLLGGSMFVGVTENIEVVESLSLLYGLYTCRLNGVQKLEIRGDNQTVIRKVKSQARSQLPANQLGSIISAIKGQLKFFKEWDILHVDREFNYTADVLASKARELEHTVTYRGMQVPNFLNKAFANDFGTGRKKIRRY